MTIPARFVSMRPLQNGKYRVVVDVNQVSVTDLSKLIAQECFITLGVGAKIEVLPPAGQKVVTAVAVAPTPLEKAIAAASPAEELCPISGLPEKIFTGAPPAGADSGTPAPEVTRGSPFAGVV